MACWTTLRRCILRYSRLALFSICCSDDRFATIIRRRGRSLAAQASSTTRSRAGRSRPASCYAEIRGPEHSTLLFYGRWARFGFLAILSFLGLFLILSVVGQIQNGVW